MRIVVIALATMGLICFAVAALVASRTRQYEQSSMLAAGVVTRLTAGPHHADVAVTREDGSSFTFGANSRVELMPGQKVNVRYLPAQPAASAALVGDSGDWTAWEIALVGLLMIGAACVSPLLVRVFPNVLTTAVRP